MNITIKATGLELTPPVKEYIEDKIGSLAKLISRYDAEGDVLAAVEIARTTKHHQKGDVYYAEVNLRLPKKILRAEDEDFDVRVAIGRCKDKLKREIEKYKTERGDK